MPEHFIYLLEYLYTQPIFSLVTRKPYTNWCLSTYLILCSFKKINEQINSTDSYQENHTCHNSYFRLIHFISTNYKKNNKLNHIYFIKKKCRIERQNYQIVIVNKSRLKFTQKMVLSNKPYYGLLFQKVQLKFPAFWVFPTDLSHDRSL